MRNRCRPFGYVARDPENVCVSYKCTAFEIFSTIQTGKCIFVKLNIKLIYNHVLFYTVYHCNNSDACSIIRKQSFRSWKSN